MFYNGSPTPTLGDDVVTSRLNYDSIMRILFASLFVAGLLAMSATATLANEVKAKPFHIGLGGGAFHTTTHIPGNSFNAWVPGYSLELGYAPWQWLETGVLLTGGGNKKVSANGQTANVSLNPYLQWYLRSRVSLGDHLGLYGQLGLGREQLNLTQAKAGNNALTSEQILSLSAGGGLSWQFTPQYGLDTGVFKMGIPLSRQSSGFNVSTIALITTLRYSFGAGSGGKPVEQAYVEPEIEAIQPIVQAESQQEPQIVPVDQLDLKPEIEKTLIVAQIEKQPTLNNDESTLQSIETPAPKVAAAPVDTASIETAPMEIVKANTDEQDLLDALESWRTQWSNMDSAAYFQAYAGDFIPAHRSLAAWKNHKQGLFDRRGYMQVRISHVVVDIDEDGKRALVYFHQQYDAANYHSNDRKKLLFEKEGSRWLIIGEHATPISAFPVNGLGVGLGVKS